MNHSGGSSGLELAKRCHANPWHQCCSHALELLSSAASTENLQHRELQYCVNLQVVSLEKIPFGTSVSSSILPTTLL